MRGGKDAASGGRTEGGAKERKLLIFSCFLSLLLFFLAAGIPARAADHAAVERQFQNWLKTDLWPQARKDGISARTFDEAFNGVSLNWSLPDLVPPGEKPKTPKIQHQAEFGSPANYFAEPVMGHVVAGGRQRMTKYRKTLAAVEQRYGVPGPIVLAIWGRETGFGAAALRYNAFQLLGTKAFMGLRKDLFQKELLAALEIVQKGYIGPDQMKSSWAGALGQPQFLPSSYLKHAVDFDGNGKRDIWHSVPDTLASIAHYLQQYGWVRGRGWGFEVEVPKTVSCSLEGPDRGKTIAAWAAMGIRRVGGKPFPAHELKKEGFLMMPAGRLGPAFIVTPNFYVLKEYNTSDLYALFVGDAADRMEGAPAGLSHPWGKVDTLYRSTIAAMQRTLQKKGYDVGGADGFPGFKTRRSIGEWQEKNDKAPTCFPDARLVKELG